MFDILDQAIGESPASRVRVDDVVATVRRRGRRARLVSAAGAAVAVAVVLELAVVGSSGPGHAPSSALDSHQPVGWPTIPELLRPSAVDSVRPTSPVDANQARLAAALAEDLRAARPGIQISGSDYDGGVVIRHALDPGMNPFDRYGATLDLTGPDGAGVLLFQAEPGRPLASQWTAETVLARRWLSSCAEFRPPAPGTGQQCHPSLGADGQGIVTVTEQAATGAVAYQVFVSWADAQVTVALSSESGRPPLTLVQLVLIAQDPRLAPR
jgi:hypothetical protein